MGTLFRALPDWYAVLLPVLVVSAVVLAVLRHYLFLPVVWFLGILVAKTALMLSTSPEAQAWGNLLISIATVGLLAGFFALIGLWFQWVHRHRIPTLAPGQLPVGTVLMPGAAMALTGNASWYPYLPAMEWVETGLASLPVLFMLLVVILIRSEKRRARVLE